MKHIIIVVTFLIISLFVSGCATGSRWQIHSADVSFGTKQEIIVHTALLLDSKTGKTWVYDWDDRGVYWLPITMTNAPSKKKLP
jgi:hypothetical protein